MIRSPIFGLPNEDWFPARAARANEAAKAMSAATAPVPNVKSGEPKPHEPSMEEILESIRRIIADDQALPITPRLAPSLRTVDSGRAANEASRRGLRSTIQPGNSDEDFKSSLAATVSSMRAPAPPPNSVARPTIEITPEIAGQERENASPAAAPRVELSIQEPVVDEILPQSVTQEPRRRAELRRIVL